VPPQTWHSPSFAEKLDSDGIGRLVRREPGDGLEQPVRPLQPSPELFLVSRKRVDEELEAGGTERPLERHAPAAEHPGQLAAVEHPAMKLLPAPDAERLGVVFRDLGEEGRGRDLERLRPAAVEIEADLGPVGDEVQPPAAARTGEREAAVESGAQSGVLLDQPSAELLGRSGGAEETPRGAGHGPPRPAGTHPTGADDKPEQSDNHGDHAADHHERGQDEEFAAGHSSPRF
jgi:hypothetical protein